MYLLALETGAAAGDQSRIAGGVHVNTKNKSQPGEVVSHGAPQ